MADDGSAGATRRGRGAGTEVASLCRYRNGLRGFSGSPRIGRHGGLKMPDMIESADENTTVIVQIEDLEALDAVDAIAGVPGIDALFLGRADLAAAMGLSSTDAPEIRDAVLRVSTAAHMAAKPVCAFVADAQDASWLEQQGVSVFLLSSDHGFLRAGASRALGSIRPA